MIYSSIILLFLSVVSPSGATSDNRTCSPLLRAAETKRFHHCQKGLYFLSKYYYNPADFCKEFDPAGYNKSDLCTGHGGSSCDFLKFIANTCRDQYNTCHTEEEQKEVIRFWIKQFVRETIKNPEALFTDKSEEIRNGECIDTLERFFEHDEIEEILKWIQNIYIPDEDSVYDTLKRAGAAYNRQTNLTQFKFGNIVDEDGNRIDTERFKDEFKDPELLKKYSAPSHWTYCSWQLTDRFLKLNPEFREFLKSMPNVFRCDGKCNTNNGDDQLWLEPSLGVGGTYKDRETGEFENEEWINNLLSAYDDDGIYKCYLDTSIDYSNTKCQKFENFVHNCSSLIDECLEDFAIREMVMGEFLIEFSSYNFKYEDCNKISSSDQDHVTPSIIAFLLVIIILTANKLE